MRGDWIKRDAIVIDVGTTRVARADGGYDMRGDVLFDEAVHVAGAITPGPHGCNRPFPQVPSFEPRALHGAARGTFRRNISSGV